MKKAANTLPASRRFSTDSRSVPGGGGPASGAEVPGGSSTMLRLRSNAVPTTERRPPAGAAHLAEQPPVDVTSPAHGVPLGKQLDPHALALDDELFSEAQRAGRERVLPGQRARLAAPGGR